MNVSPVEILLIGREAGRLRLRPYLAAVGARVTEADSLPIDVAAPFVIFALEEPDQFPAAQVMHVLAAAATVRVLCVRFEWGASMLRSRTIWPAAVVVDFEVFPRRLELELAAMDGTVSALPLTAGLDEIAQVARWTGPPLNARKTAVVHSRDEGFRKLVMDQLVEAGLDVCPGTLGIADVSVVDVDSNPELLEQWQAGRLAEASDRSLLVALSSWWREPAQRDACHVVRASRFSRPDEWLRWLGCWLVAVLLILNSGCGRPATPIAKESTSPSWEQQIANVRSGEGVRIQTTAAVSKDQWRQLANGCATLQQLEVGEVRLAPDDYALLANLPNLRRLKLSGPIRDADAAQIADAESIEELLLSSDELTDQGIEELCRLPLVQLRLRAPRGTDRSAKAIETLRNVRFLHLIELPLTDAALPSFVALEELESLYLDHTRCSDDGLSSLLKARPDIHFHLDQTHLRDDPQKHPH